MDTNERCNHGTTIDANMASAAVDGHDISSQDQAVRKKDSHPEAVLMIPPNGEEPPLTQNELRMEFGAPIIEHGIDYTCIREEYLAAVNNETIPDERKLPSLAELIRQEAKSQRLLDFGLLIAHDSRQHQKECHSNFKMWVRKKFGVKWSDNTIDRRIIHARVMLLFAMNGVVDNLPTQNQANAIYRLPRSAWLPFWKEARLWKKTSVEALKNSAASYAKDHDLPMRGQAIYGPFLLRAEADQRHDPSGEAEPQQVDSKPKRLRRMAEELTAAIADYLPEKKVEAMRDKNSHYGMVYLKAINEQVQSSRNSKLEAKRIKLLKEIEQLHPLLAKKIVAAAVCQFFAQVDNRLD